MSNDRYTSDYDDMDEAKFIKFEKPHRFNVKDRDRKENWKEKRKCKEKDKTKFLTSKAT